MMKTTYTYILIKCQNCNFPMWSDKHEEILQFKELIEKKALRCPRCNEIITGWQSLSGNGGRANSSPSPFQVAKRQDGNKSFSGPPPPTSSHPAECFASAHPHVKEDDKDE